MNVLGIILGIILGFIALIFVGIIIDSTLTEKNRKRRIKNWKIGDKIALKRNDYKDILRKKNKDFAILKGWDLKNLYIDCGDGMVYQTSWSVMNYNKSATWRQNYEEAKKVMGCNPAFTYEVNDSRGGSGSSFDGQKYEGKIIEVMSEIECEVYLKKALDEENYEAADLIRKRKENFR
jgi:hypothetical protein